MASDAKVDLLQCADTAVLVEVDAGGAHMAEALVARGVDREGRADVAEIKCAYAHLREGDEAIGAARVLLLRAQIGKDAAVFVYPVVAVGVVACKIGETIAAYCAGMLAFEADG
jgi:hypothetical protein